MRKSLWFYYKSSRFSFLFRLKISFQLMVLNWKHPSHWKESIVFCKFFSHLHKISTHQILSSEVKHSWKMVYFLIWLHSGQSLGLYSIISPKNIPILRFRVGLKFPAKTFSNSRNYGVLTICHIQKEVPEMFNIILPLFLVLVFFVFLVITI